MNMQPAPLARAPIPSGVGASEKRDSDLDTLSLRRGRHSRSVSELIQLISRGAPAAGLTMPSRVSAFMILGQ
jgi:hypothetical protein